MWNEKAIKILPSAVFLFCLLEIFELVLTISYTGKIEKLEVKVIENLKASEDIVTLLNKHLRCMDWEHFKDKKIKGK
ncbi:hypothetical protein VN0785_09910 [Helicobacter pylori]